MHQVNLHRPMKVSIALVLLYWIGMFGAHAQGCPQKDLVFTTQNEIDSFAIQYPDCHDVEGSVRIEGLDIVHLDGLSQLTSIGGSLRITETSLSSFSGLENLKSVKSVLSINKNPSLINFTGLDKLDTIGLNLFIFSNDSLTSLTGLQSADVFPFLTYLHISDNPQLKDCGLPNICNYLGHYRKYFIHENAPGCRNREDVLATCPWPADTTDRMELFWDGFEEWTPDSLPAYWSVQYGVYEGVPNVEKTDSLDEGHSAMVLRSNIPGSIEGPIETEAYYSPVPNEGVIDLAFTYTCKGEGTCRVILGQAGKGSSGANHREVWIVGTGDTTPQTVLLQNIMVNPPFDSIAFIGLGAAPHNYGTHTHGLCEFTVDNLTITKKTSTTAIQPVLSPNIHLFPNPAHTQLFIQTPLRIDRMYIVDLFGREQQVDVIANQIDIHTLSPGLYMLIVESGHQRWVSRFSKI